MYLFPDLKSFRIVKDLDDSHQRELFLSEKFMSYYKQKKKVIREQQKEEEEEGKNLKKKYKRKFCVCT